RPAAVAEAPAAVIFPPSGGFEVRRSEPARSAVVAQAAPQPRRQAAPKAPQPNPVAPPSADDGKSSAAGMLAKAATAASAAAETAKREAAVVAEKAERRTTLAVFGGAMLVILTGIAYSVYRVARTSPLRGVAVCLMELGALMAVLAYPVAELWARLKISES